MTKKEAPPRTGPSELGARKEGAKQRDFLWGTVENVISFLTLRKCGIISNFGVNLADMSESRELEPHPSVLSGGCVQLILSAARVEWCAGRLGVWAEEIALGGFTTG